MGIQHGQQQDSLNILLSLSAAGAGTIIMGIILVPISVQAQPSKVLQPICIGIASAVATQGQASCCRANSKGKCMTLEQAFPGSGGANLPRNQDRAPFSEIEFVRPTPVFKPRTSGSEAAAKDAVVQMGITKMLDAIAPNSESILSPSASASKSHRKDSFFQRARHDFEQIRQDYEYVFRPRSMASGAVITPKLNVDFSSLKAGFKIEF